MQGHVRLDLEEVESACLKRSLVGQEEAGSACPKQSEARSPGLAADSLRWARSRLWSLASLRRWERQARVLALEPAASVRAQPVVLLRPVVGSVHLNHSTLRHALEAPVVAWRVGALLVQRGPQRLEPQRLERQRLAPERQVLAQVPLAVPPQGQGQAQVRPAVPSEQQGAAFAERAPPLGLAVVGQGGEVAGHPRALGDEAVASWSRRLPWEPRLASLRLLRRRSARGGAPRGRPYAERGRRALPPLRKTHS